MPSLKWAKGTTLRIGQRYLTFRLQVKPRCRGSLHYRASPQSPGVNLLEGPASRLLLTTTVTSRRAGVRCQSRATALVDGESSLSPMAIRRVSKRPHGRETWVSSAWHVLGATHSSHQSRIWRCILSIELVHTAARRSCLLGTCRLGTTGLLPSTRTWLLALELTQLVQTQPCGRELLIIPEISR